MDYILYACVTQGFEIYIYVRQFWGIFSGHVTLIKNASHTHIAAHLAAKFVQHDPATVALVE